MSPGHRLIMLLARLVANLCLSLSLLIPAWALAADTPSPDQLMQEGLTAFRKGSFPQAVLSWTEAARTYEQEGKVREQGQALLQLSQALQQVGSYREAGAALTIALDLAKKRGDQTQLPVILGRLGTIFFVLGEDQRAEQLLNDALVIARETQRSPLAASLLNDLGNVLAAQGRHAAAIGAYRESGTLARAAGNHMLAVTAMINAAKTATRQGQPAEAQTRLDRVADEIPTLEDSHEKAFAWLSLGLAYEGLLPRTSTVRPLQEEALGSARGSRGIEVRPGEEEPVTGPGLLQGELSGVAPIAAEGILKQAAASFWSAMTVATGLEDAKAESYAWGYLGSLYERQGRVEEALELTRRAVLAAQRVHAPESLYRWHWQTGRLLKAQGKLDEAILAYRRAMLTLQPIRHELLVGNRERQTSFRDTTGPLFFELSDLLLRRAAATKEQDPPRHRELLLQAQDTVELFKAAELQDYFKDECVAAAQARSTTLAEGSQTTAVIYPIILPDRLELLVSLPGGLKQFVVRVKSQALTEEVRAFRAALEDRSNSTYLVHAGKLYDWMLRPIQPDLESAGITTLVFVPDGSLRTIPMAPLYDGTQFLISKYAIAVTPGLTLTDPRPINRGNVKLLSAGLSESVQGFPPLPNVTKELNAIRTLFGGKLLLNDQFQVVKMEGELKEQPFTILHIASHGTVERDVKNSFILAFDDKITMDRLSQLVGLYQFRDAPLELLTLSACETAAGDDRAALGLAGVAIKAGARSALATLWFIDDAATSELVAEFYRQLQNPALSKAAALQRAQLHILNDPERQHPSYWAPFLLINNWL